MCESEGARRTEGEIVGGWDDCHFFREAKSAASLPKKGRLNEAKAKQYELMSFLVLRRRDV